MLLDSTICDFGWKAQDFHLKDPSGKEISLFSLMGEKGLLIAFICNHCPYVKAIIDRLVEDATNTSIRRSWSRRNNVKQLSGISC